MPADWDRFTVRINIKNVPIEKLYWAWASRIEWNIGSCG
jgi:hypothetical protein